LAESCISSIWIGRRRLGRFHHCRSNGSITTAIDVELSNAITFDEAFYHDLEQDYERLIRERSKLIKINLSDDSP
jgi:hypothetical protein